MHLFYTPDITSDVYTLNEEESKHCVRVLRLIEGDKIKLVDGKGNWFEAEITDANPKRCSVKTIEKKTDVTKNYKLHIGIAPTKNMDRLEWFLEKSTEIGFDEITPIECDNSERTIVKAERLNKVLVSAMKQSLKSHLPYLNDLTSFKKFILTTSHFSGQKFIAHCYNDEKKLLQQVYQKNSDAMILIGPEGDFSKPEVDLAIQNGFVPVSLGTSRLRTETAGLVACHTINLLNQ